MINAQVKTKTVDHTKELILKLKEISEQQVYVGVPEEKSPRKKQGVNNAQLVFIHTNGSPIRRIPARPIIEPAIEAEDNKEKIAGELAQAGRAMLDSKPDQARQYLEKAGMRGQNAARGWFDDPRNGWPENSPLTAARKLKKLKGKARKEAMARLEAEETTESISRPLIDTAQMRKSIVYVVKGDE